MSKNNKKRRIAVVEDNPDNMLLLRVLLQEHFELQEYADGLSATEGIIKDPPDLVLMDISLPTMNGVKVLQRLRQEEKLARLPVIALTGHAIVGDKEQFLADGFDYYLSKPIHELAQLMDPIQALLEGK